MLNLWFFGFETKRQNCSNQEDFVHKYLFGARYTIDGADHPAVGPNESHGRSSTSIVPLGTIEEPSPNE